MYESLGCTAKINCSRVGVLEYMKCCFILGAQCYASGVNQIVIILMFGLEIIFIKLYSKWNMLLITTY